MALSIAFSLLLAAASPQASDGDYENHFCGEATGIYLPAPQGTPAPNIKLENFQFMSPGDRCGRDIEQKELMRLHDGIKPIAAAAFSSSRSSFAVMVRYTLTPDRPAVFDMQTADAPASEQQRLTDFYHRAAALQDFHAKKGTVYVVFHYRISPAK